MARGYKKPLYDKLYESGTKAGYSVEDVNSYPGANAEKDSSDTWSELKGKTPFTFEGQPIGYYATIHHGASRQITVGSDGDKLNHVASVEFWTMDELGGLDRNLEDVLADTDKTIWDVSFTDKDGKDHDFVEASKEAGFFAASASEYPHAVTYDEYVKNHEVINKRLKTPAPGPKDYAVYANHFYKLSRDPMVKTIGRRTAADNLMEADELLEHLRDGNEAQASDEMEI